MSTLDLDQDYTVNGHTFKAGKDVETTVNFTDNDGKQVKSDCSQAIKDMMAASKTATEFAEVHHGAVEDSESPKEDTPTEVGTDGSTSNKKDK